MIHSFIALCPSVTLARQSVQPGPVPRLVPSSLDCLSGRCRSAQTALAWPCITVAANQFESSGAHVKKKKESPKKRTTNFIFVAKTPLTAAPSLKRVKITTNLFGYAANCYSTPSIRSSSTSSSTSSSFFLLVLIIKNRWLQQNKLHFKEITELEPEFLRIDPPSQEGDLSVCEFLCVCVGQAIYKSWRISSWGCPHTDSNPIGTLS